MSHTVASNRQTILVLGATGATGKLVVETLLDQKQNVKAIVRTATRLPESIRDHQNLSVIEASIADLSDTEVARQMEGCRAVVSCLGHNLTFKGVFGPPRRLVTEATRRICRAIQLNGRERPTRFVLMNTAGNRNRGVNEPVSFAQRIVVGLIRLLLPPHADNEDAADYLRTEIGQNNQAIEWVVVRPDTLTNESEATEYTVYKSPIRSAIFNAGVTSRINVAHFIVQLLNDDPTWNEWAGQMPVIYNRSDEVIQ